MTDITNMTDAELDSLLGLDEQYWVRRNGFYICRDKTTTNLFKRAGVFSSAEAKEIAESYAWTGIKAEVIEADIHF